MGDNTAIEWASAGLPGKGATWNLWTGCDKVSAGCKFCYAERFYDTRGKARQKFTDVVVHPDQLTMPLAWQRPRGIFVNSLSDFFHAKVTDEQRDQALAVIACSQRHRYIVLTKREAEMVRYMGDSSLPGRIADAIETAAWVELYGLRTDNHQMARDLREGDMWPLFNLVLGVSIENRATVARLEALLRVPAALRVASVEPQLEDLADEIEPYLWPQCILSSEAHNDQCGGGDWCDERNLDWVIQGGESGPGARMFAIEWARAMRDKCAEAGVAYFLKQLGSDAALRNLGTAVRHRKGADESEWPEDLRGRRAFPDFELAERRVRAGTAV